MENVEVTAIRRAINNPGATVTATSDEDGFVQMQLIRSTWAFLLRDLEAPTSPLRNGTIYVPTAIDSFPMPGSGGLVDDACGPGVPGMPLTTSGAPKGVGKVVLSGAPQQGYLEVTVTDPAALNAPPLAGATVVSATLREDNTGGTILTDASGKVRIPCYAGATNNVTITKDGYLPVSPPKTCSAGPNTWLNTLDVKLWRTPIHVEFTVSNETNLARGATGQTAIPSDAPPAARVSTARVSVTKASPVLSTGLRDLVPAVCLNVAAAQPVANGVTLDNRVPAQTGPLTTPYICSAPTDTLGRATLILPWAEVGEYELTVSAPGYQSHVETEAITQAWLAPDNAEAPGRIHRDDITLGRVTVTNTSYVRNLQGAFLADATVKFRQDGADKSSTVTGADGKVEVSLPTGVYDIVITRAGNQTRNCAATLGADGVLGLTPAYCFTLLTTAKTGITGVIRDDLTSAPAPDVWVCGSSGGNLACDLSDATGAYQIEVPTNTNANDGANPVRVFRPPTGPLQPWWQFSGAHNGSVLNTGATAGTIIELAPKAANRTRIQTTLHVQNEAVPPVGIAFADVTLHRGAVMLHDTTQNFTNAQGDAVILCGTASPPAVCPTVWTTMPGKPQFDLADLYLATAMKHRKDVGEGNGPLYQLKSSALFPIPWTGEAAFVHTLTLDPETGAQQVAVRAVDAHTGATATLATLQAISPSPDFAAGPTQLSTGGGALLLYPGGNPYRVCSVATELYVEDLGARCASDVVAGQSAIVTVLVNRTLTNVTVRGVDAHTSWLLAGYNVSATGRSGFACNPQGTFANSAYKCVRSTTVAGSFNVNLEVPWTDAADDLCLVGAARTYRAILPGTPSNAGQQGQAVNVGEDVGFAAARLCGIWPPASTTTVDVKPLRVPSTNLVSGSVKLDSGAAATGATVSVASDRPGFVCSPAADAHHSTHVAMCAATIGTDGRYAIPVPAVSANSTWIATASKTGYYSETYDRWPDAAGIAGDFTLFAREFNAVVRIIDTSATGAAQLCGSNGFPVAAWAHDMQGADPNPQNPTVRRTATRQTDSTCLAILPITQWHRDPQPMPVAVNQPWPVTNAPFLVASDSEDRFGEVVAMLGPRDADRTVTIHMVSSQTTAAAGAFGVSGRLFDADVLDAVSGQVGVAARVGAVALDGTCAGSGANVIANATGTYTLPLTCAATYRITVLPMVGSHWKDLTFDVTLTPAAPVATRNLPIERQESTLTVTTFRVPSGPANGIIVDPAGVDVKADPRAQVSEVGGQVQFPGIPWGVYRITGSVGTVPLVKFVQPGSDSATVFRS